MKTKFIVWTKSCIRRILGHNCPLINDPVIISLQSTKVYVFSDSVLCLGKVLQHPECNEAWKNRVAGVRAERNYSDFEDVKGEPTEFEWNIFPGFTSLQLCDRIINLLSSLGQSPETFTGRILFMSMFNDISRDRNVKGMNPAPHIHEHLRYTIMATALRTPSRITTSRLSTLR